MTACANITDPTSFNGLFYARARSVLATRDPTAMHILLADLVHYVSGYGKHGGIRLKNESYRDEINDATKDRLVELVDAGKVNPFKNPAAYLRTAANRKLWELARQNESTDTPREDFSRVRAMARFPVDPMRKANAVRFSHRRLAGADRKRSRVWVDACIDRASAMISEAETDAARARVGGYIDALQEVRKTWIGSYRPATSHGARFTEDRRIATGED